MTFRRSVDDFNSRYVQGGTTDMYPNRAGWWERRKFTKHDSDVEFTITDNYDKRPHKLAYDIYGRDDYFFIILQYNNILDINEEFVAGKIILLPTPNRVMMEFFTKRTGGKTT